MSYSDNSEEVARFWEQHAAASRDHVLELQNVTAYAKYLHDKFGYYVFSDPKLLAVVIQWLEEVVSAGLVITDDNIARALDSAGYEVIGFLQSLTGEMRPPVKAGEGPRKAHPGSWSDVTGRLAGAYQHLVDNGAIKQHPYSG
jgi:hypothetical protein